MLKSSARSAIRLRGVRHNNLKNFDLDLPLNQLIVVTGLSGSGKSSLAFDTLFAEGQRRYIETFSPYARQFFDRMDKPQVDSIEGIPPAIAIEQRNAVKTTRSTVGTMTEICDYMKMLWPHLAELHCRQCGRLVCRESPGQILAAIEKAAQRGAGTEEAAPECLITFDLPLTEKLSLEECLALVAKQGYQRLLVRGQIVRLEEVEPQGAGASVEAGGKANTEQEQDQGSRARVLPKRPARMPALPVDASITVIQDRLRPGKENRARFVEACEQAYHFGKGKLAIYLLDAATGAPGPALRFSNRLHCASCDIEYHEPSPALFSFNHPVGACPACRGFGRVIRIDYDLAVPDRSRTLAEGVVKPWQTGLGAECQDDLLRMCAKWKIPTDVPFERLPKKWQDFVIEGEPGYGKDSEHEWPSAWYGVKGYFRWLESRAYKMHVRVLLSRYRAYTPCPDCHGKRFQPEALLYVVRSPLHDRRNGASAERGHSGEETSVALCRAAATEHAGRDAGAPSGGAAGEWLSLADFYQMPIREALRFVDRIAKSHNWQPADPLGLVLGEVRSRLGYLEEVGLGYLTLDRPTRSLSGGETERVNLTTCLGTRLVNTLFVLDEPSVGLHPRDTDRLVRILKQLRDAGNTVLVVEHEASVMRAANQIVDLGPGHGATGGEVVFQGTYQEICRAAASLTGQYLSGRKQIAIPERRAVAAEPGALVLNEAAVPYRANGSEIVTAGARTPRPRICAQGETAPRGQGVRAPAGWLRLSRATRHNLKDLVVDIPLGRFVCVTGVSGSGKTTLVREVLLPALAARLKADRPQVKASDRLAEEQNGDDENGEGAPEALSGAVLEGCKTLGGVVLVDQSILGKTPRSNPAVYIGAFDDIREFYAQSEPARQRGLNASAFSFNSAQGQCERCRGAGFEKIEMQFLSDVFIRCPDCHGRRYRDHILEVKVTAATAPRETEQEQGPKSLGASARHSKEQEQGARSKEQGKLTARMPGCVSAGLESPAHSRQVGRKAAPHAFSIADLLEATVEEAVDFLEQFPESRPARRAVRSLRLLEETGLGYLKLGQPINTLSGGESQRLKLVSHLAEVAGGEFDEPASAGRGGAAGAIPAGRKPLLFLFDEPTTGLHFDDVRVLLKVFQRLVDAGHSVVVIEHNLDVIKSVDWLLDLGPDAGDQGGQLVTAGTPEDVAACPQSHTGRALREVLPRSGRSHSVALDEPHAKGAKDAKETKK